MDKKTTINDKKTWSKVDDFNLSRTNIWILFGWQLLETIIPFLLIWFFISPDFQSWNYYSSFGNHQVLIFTLTSCALLIWALAINLITFFTKLQKADSFTFTMSFMFVLFAVLINGLWQYEWTARMDLKIFLRFLIALFVLIPAMFFGLFLTSWFRNVNYKIEENEQAMIAAYRGGELVPTKKTLKLNQALKNQAKRDQERQELMVFKEQLDQQLTTSYDRYRDKVLAREAKLDAKENKKREKNNLKKRK